jgi:hypothetical protein
MRESKHGPANTPRGFYRQFKGLASVKENERLKVVRGRYPVVDCLRAGESEPRNNLFRFSSYMRASAMCSS